MGRGTRICRSGSSSRAKWSYAHTNYVILGLAVEKITRMPLQTAISQYVLRPLGLRNTTASQTPAIPAPVLHTVTSERRTFRHDPPAGQMSKAGHPELSGRARRSVVASRDGQRPLDVVSCMRTSPVGRRAILPAMRSSLADSAGW
jgi:CubicO group peptidase (beta-lactamase class C family)